MTEEPTTDQPDDREKFIAQTLNDVRRILLERLEGNFQIVWTGYDDETGETRTHCNGYGNIHARIGAAEAWVARERSQMSGDDYDVAFEPWDDNFGEPE